MNRRCQCLRLAIELFQLLQRSVALVPLFAKQAEGALATAGAFQGLAGQECAQGKGQEGGGDDTQCEQKKLHRNCPYLWLLDLASCSVTPIGTSLRAFMALPLAPAASILDAASCGIPPHWGDGVGTLRGSSVPAEYSSYTSVAPRCRTQIPRGRILRPRHPLGCPSLGSILLPPSKSMAVTEVNCCLETSWCE